MAILFGFDLRNWFRFCFDLELVFINTQNPNIGSPSILVPFNISNFTIGLK